MRPGVEVTSLAQAPPRSAPTDTGTAFMTANVQKGTVGLVRSMSEYETVFGVRTGYEDPYDYADAYFREGGVRLYVSPLGAGGTALDTALAALNTQLGPGQLFDVSDPATVATRDKLLAHAAACNRVALLEAPVGTAASVIAIGQALQAKTYTRYGALFGPNAILPGVAGGTTRTIGFPPLVAGMIARNDPKTTPNVPSAGVNGRSAYALDLSDRYSDQEYQDLNVAGVDMAKMVYGQIEMYGWRSAVLPTGPDGQNWLSFGNARLNMAIVAQANAIGERYVFSQLDGRGKTIAQFGSELRAMLIPFYEAGALFGETADDAFSVNVGNQVNTPQTISAGELHAVIEVQMSPFAEKVVIQIVKVATSVAVAA